MPTGDVRRNLSKPTGLPELRQGSDLMGIALAGTDYTTGLYDDILTFDVSDEELEAAAGMEISPHKTGCSSYCWAGSCNCIAWAR